MKKTFSKRKSAFSLIELSIVLIIIGLLIAGVTGGASLIKSSELRSVMGEARGYAVAVNAFFTQYNGLPGDYATPLGTVVGVATPDAGLAVGDGDNRIEFCTTNCSADTATATGSEGAIAWQHLRFAGAIDVVPTFTGGATATQTVGVTGNFNYPGSKIRGGGWGFDYNTVSLQNVVVLTGSTTVGAVIDGNSLVNGAVIATGVITPADALSIDSKIDDRIANGGRVRGIDGFADPTINPVPTCLNAVAPVNYNVADTNRNCALSYQIDVNT